MTPKDIAEFNRKLNQLCEWYGITDAALFACLGDGKHIVISMESPTKECNAVKNVVEAITLAAIPTVHEPSKN